MLCIDICLNKIAIIPIKGKTESALALGFIECMNKMGGPPQVIMTDGEGAIKHNGLVRKNCTDNHLTYIQSRGHPVFAERMVRPFNKMIDKRIKPDEQWTDLKTIPSIYNHKFVHSTT